MADERTLRDVQPGSRSTAAARLNSAQDLLITIRHQIMVAPELLEPPLVTGTLADLEHLRRELAAVQELLGGPPGKE